MLELGADGHYYGPGSPYHEDALAPECVWGADDRDDSTWNLHNHWLNPEFNHVAPWAKKSSESQAKILFLVPASIGSRWFAEYVNRKAYVLGLDPRLTFKGSKDPYPKDLMLCCFNFYGFTGFDTWRWK